MSDTVHNYYLISLVKLKVQQQIPALFSIFTAQALGREIRQYDAAHKFVNKAKRSNMYFPLSKYMKYIIFISFSSAALLLAGPELPLLSHHPLLSSVH